MNSNSILIEIWLSKKLQQVSELIEFSAIYGSISRNAFKPKDCDLLVVGKNSPHTKEWFKLKEYLSSLKGDFKDTFILPLSICLLTKGEAEEFKNFFSCALILNIEKD